MDFYKLTIQEIKRQTPSAVTLQFNVPETLEKNFSFLAGQYVTLKITEKNLDVLILFVRRHKKTKYKLELKQ